MPGARRNLFLPGTFRPHRVGRDLESENFGRMESRAVWPQIDVWNLSDLVLSEWEDLSTFTCLPVLAQAQKDLGDWLDARSGKVSAETYSGHATQKSGDSVENSEMDHSKIKRVPNMNLKWYVTCLRPAVGSLASPPLPSVVLFQPT